MLDSSEVESAAAGGVFIGLDWGNSHHQLCILDAAGRMLGAILAEARNTTVTDDDITAHPESCRPCPMCANAIRRAPISRVVLALDTDQLDALKPSDHQNPDAAGPAHDGPALLEEAQRPVEGYYH